MATHLEVYLDLLKSLPNDFSRDLSLIQVLDEKSEELKQEIKLLEQDIQTCTTERKRLNVSHESAFHSAPLSP
jgi:hypothetical protein